MKKSILIILSLLSITTFANDDCHKEEEANIEAIERTLERCVMSIKYFGEEYKKLISDSCERKVYEGGDFADAISFFESYELGGKYKYNTTIKMKYFIKKALLYPSVTIIDEEKELLMDLRITAMKINELKKIENIRNLREELKSSQKAENDLDWKKAAREAAELTDNELGL